MYNQTNYPRMFLHNISQLCSVQSYMILLTTEVYTGNLTALFVIRMANLFCASRCLSRSILSVIKHAEHAAAICAQCDTRGRGLNTEHTGASICMEERDGNTPLMQGAPRGQVDLIALREHVCWCRLVEHLRKGVEVVGGGAAICHPAPLKP